MNATDRAGQTTLVHGRRGQQRQLATAAEFYPGAGEAAGSPH